MLPIVTKKSVYMLSILSFNIIQDAREHNVKEKQNRTKIQGR
jgi:hypothetical protein